MLITKQIPVSVDIPVQAFQNYLYKNLKKLWPVDDTNFDGYGRCYRNANGRGYVPEIKMNSVDPNDWQYAPIFFDKQTKKALFFFDIADNQPYNFSEGLETDKVSLIFITNISKLKPSIQHRGDEEVANDVQKLCSTGYMNFLLTGSETGFTNVFKSFNGLINKDGEVFEDRHPMYCFKFNFDLIFDPTEETCTK